MTISKLLELMIKVEEKQIDIWDVDELKDYTDEEIDLIISSKNKREVKLLLNNKEFRNQSKEVQKEIIEIIGNTNVNNNILYYVVNVATNKNTINSGYLKEIIDILIKIENEDKISLVSNIVKDQIAIKHKDILIMIQMIIDSSLDKNILKYAEMLIKNQFVYRTGNILEKLKSILTVKTEEEADKIYWKYMTEGLTISLLESLDKERIDEINFWDLLKEDPETAVKLFIYGSFSEEILNEEPPTMFTKKEYDKLNNKYILEDITQLKEIQNIELPSNIKIKKRKKSNKR